MTEKEIVKAQDNNTQETVRIETMPFFLSGIR